MEYYYANIDLYARRAGQAVMGKTFSGAGKDKQSAENDANHKAIQQITQAILDQTRVRAVACNVSGAPFEATDTPRPQCGGSPGDRQPAISKHAAEGK